MKITAISCALALGVLGSVAQVGMAQSTSANPAPSAPAADNSKSNKVDPSNRAMTADSQKENTTDRQLTAKIRKSIVADKSLSTYAHNVKIVASNGQVTLNGVVRSDEEKSSVEAKAVAVAGKGQVVNDLKVTAK